MRNSDTRTEKNCRYQTLNDALASCNLVAEWPLGTNINYGQTVRVNTDRYHISVYRDENGLYEEPVWYRVAKTNRRRA